MKNKMKVNVISNAPGGFLEKLAVPGHINSNDIDISKEIELSRTLSDYTLTHGNDNSHKQLPRPSKFIL
jgi:hypothetical protein